MFDNLCLICIHYDASLDMLQRHVQRLYSPEVEKVYVRISKNVDIIKRAGMLKAVRDVFIGSEINIVTVADYQIRLVAAMVDYAENRILESLIVNNNQTLRSCSQTKE